MCNVSLQPCTAMCAGAVPGADIGSAAHIHPVWAGGENAERRAEPAERQRAHNSMEQGSALPCSRPEPIRVSSKPSQLPPATRQTRPSPVVYTLLGGWDVLGGAAVAHAVYADACTAQMPFPSLGCGLVQAWQLAEPQCKGSSHVNVLLYGCSWLKIGASPAEEMRCMAAGCSHCRKLIMGESVLQVPSLHHGGAPR